MGLYMKFTWDNGRLESKMIHPPGMETPVWLEKVIVMGASPAQGPAKVISSTGEESVDTFFDYSTKVLTIRKPGVNLGDSWSLHL